MPGLSFAGRPLARLAKSITTIGDGIGIRHSDCAYSESRPQFRRIQTHRDKINN